MCDYKVLCHNESGYVILCNSCQHYQLAFGTTAVTFEPDKFNDFCEIVNEIKNDTECNGFERQKRFSLNIFSRLSMMVLSFKELTALHELLEEAVFNEQLEGMMQDLKVINE